MEIHVVCPFVFFWPIREKPENTAIFKFEIWYMKGKISSVILTFVSNSWIWGLSVMFP